MPKKSEPDRGRKVAAAYLLSYPQMFVWAVVFALIGGITVWSSKALPHSATKPGASITLRMVTDTNGNGLPNWNDTIVFDESTWSVPSAVLNLDCYQSGKAVYHAQRIYSSTSSQSGASQYIQLDSATWPEKTAADCIAMFLYDQNGQQDILSSYNFHVNP